METLPPELIKYDIIIYLPITDLQVLLESREYKDLWNDQLFRTLYDNIHLVIRKDDNQTVYEYDGIKHRLDGPTVVSRSACYAEIWHKLGKIHREGNLPAITIEYDDIITTTFLKEEKWYINGYCERADERPHVVNSRCENGVLVMKQETWTNKEGRCDRINGPALILTSFGLTTELWRHDGKVNDCIVKDENGKIVEGKWEVMPLKDGDPVDSQTLTREERIPELLKQYNLVDELIRTIYYY